MRRIALALVVSCLLASAFTIRARAATPSETLGESLFDLHCSSCHGVHLQGSADAPPLFGKGASDVDFMLRTGRMPAPVVWQQQLQEKPQFDDAQIRALVAYVTSAGNGSRVLPALAPGSVVRGRALFAENCQACHGVTAHGASVGASEVAPSLMHTAPEQIVEALRLGPGVMPAFGTDVVTPKDADDVVSYVVLLQKQSHANNPGGLQLANVGPVAEGFIGWVFGIGLLVLLCRRIGSTD